MSETNLTHCKICNELKSRIQDGNYNNSKDKRWRDNHGSLWVGRCCPDCHRKRMAEKQRTKRIVPVENV